MKEWLKSFLRPRVWSVFLTIILIAWQYVYAFRGIDFEVLGRVRVYFGFGIEAINWNDFFVRTFSMALIWVLVALVIFILLWLAETYVVGSHNRKIERKFTNRPKEDFAHLLKGRGQSFKNSAVSVLLFSAGLILVPVGLLLISGLMEMIRSNLVISYLIAAAESGQEVDYYSLNLVVVSFLATLPFWYLYSCFDGWCFMASRKGQVLAKIENEHYAVPVVGPAEFEEVDPEDVENDTPPPSPVI